MKWPRGTLSLARKKNTKGIYDSRFGSSKNTIRIAKHLFTDNETDWGYRSLDRNEIQTGKSFTIDVWVETHK